MKFTYSCQAHYTLLVVQINIWHSIKMDEKSSMKCYL